MKYRIGLIALAIVLAASVSACKKEEGPMEKAGKAIDKSAHDVEDAVKDAAEKAEEALEDEKGGH